jgi:hypothetical protein
MDQETAEQLINHVRDAINGYFPLAEIVEALQAKGIVAVIGIEVSFGQMVQQPAPEPKVTQEAIAFADRNFLTAMRIKVD